jgi:hypothetical protein
MDIVYICRKGNNEELRYSLRSVVKNLPEGRVWVVGYKPGWYTGDFISVPDVSSKFNNIHNLITHIAFDDRISDDFIMMNDDFFVVRPLDTVPVYHGGPLKDKINSYYDLNPTSSYNRLLSKTYNNLVNDGIQEPLDYDIHIPLPFNRTKLRETIVKKSLPRSTYGNHAGIGGEYIPDVKTYSNGSRLARRSHNFLDSELPYISCEDGSFQTIYKHVLKDMFPEPTMYECPRQESNLRPRD